MHRVSLTEEEESILESIGIENEDYAICAIFDHRTTADVQYREEERVVVVEDGESEVKQTIDMITEICESSDPLDRIRVAVSMLEIAINVEKDLGPVPQAV